MQGPPSVPIRDSSTSIRKRWEVLLAALTLVVTESTRRSVAGMWTCWGMRTRPVRRIGEMFIASAGHTVEPQGLNNTSHENVTQLTDMWVRGVILTRSDAAKQREQPQCHSM